MSHRSLLALLLPPVSYSPSEPVLQAELAAEGKALDGALASAGRVKDAITPFFAEQLIPDWERVCGIVPPADATYQQRLQAVLAKLAETGGLSIPYFIRLARGLGYNISINEPQPFRAGRSRAGDMLWVPDMIWVWQVVVHAGRVRAYNFRAGQSASGERLLTFGDPVIESLFDELKPAFSFVCFAYQEK